MKRHGNLWPQITDFSNLLNASRQAQRGKRFQTNVLNFNYELESNLLQLQEDLLTKSYQPGEYNTFQIVEPKKRMISAAPYRDRVAHHALCNVIGPIFEATFTEDSFANRKGYGTHRALDKFIGYARSNRYVLQCDIRKYFPSIDHQILKRLLRRKIKCLSLPKSFLLAPVAQRKLAGGGVFGPPGSNSKRLLSPERATDKTFVCRPFRAGNQNVALFRGFRKAFTPG